MGGDRAVQSLGGEDRIGVGGFRWLCLRVGFCGGGLESDVPGECVSGIGVVPAGKGAKQIRRGYRGRIGGYIPGLRSQSVCCNGCWRGEFGEGGLLGEDLVIVSDWLLFTFPPKG